MISILKLQRGIILQKDTMSILTIYKTRTVRKSDYTPALALPKHMAGIFDEKCREKEKKNKKENAHFQSHVTTCRCEPVYQILSFYLKRL